MQSLAFIREARKLVRALDDQRVAGFTRTIRSDERFETQKKIDQLFAGLYNPTLPSAFHLRNAALDCGYTVDRRVLNRLSQFEYLS